MQTQKTLSKLFEDEPARWEIGTGDDVHDLFKRRVWLVDQHDGCFDDFADIVRRNIRRHTDGDTAGSIDEEIGDAGR